MGNKHLFRGISLYAALSVSAAHVTALPAHASGATAPVTGVNTVHVVEKQYKTKNMDISYPEISGMDNARIEANLNHLLQKASIPQEDKSSGQDGTQIDFTGGFRVLLQRGNVLEIMLTSYSYQKGAAHGMPGQTVFLMNTKLGTLYTLSDLFQAGSRYLQKISDMIRKQDVHHVLDSFSKFIGVTNRDGFYVTDDALYVYFQPYEWTPYALGFPEFRLPYVQLTNIIDSTGSLWQEMHSPLASQQKKIEAGHKEKIEALGYTLVPKQNATTPYGSGHLLYAYDAKPKSAQDGTVEKVFFFLDTRYLGTDTLRNHGMVGSIYPVRPGTIAARYYDSAPFTIQYRWNGHQLAPNQPFPASYQFQ